MRIGFQTDGRPHRIGWSSKPFPHFLGAEYGDDEGGLDEQVGGQDGSVPGLSSLRGGRLVWFMLTTSEVGVGV